MQSLQVPFLTTISKKQFHVYNILLNDCLEEINTMKLVGEVDYDIDSDKISKVAVVNILIEMWPHEVGLIEFAKQNANLPSSLTMCN